MQTVQLALIGFGNVGKAFASLLETKRAELQSGYNLQVSVNGIYTRNHGSVIHPAGVDLSQMLELAAGGGSIGNANFEDPFEFIRLSKADILVENSSVNIVDGEPALSYMLAGLEQGMHIVTANKGPIVHAYERLVEAARLADREIRFESTVMDGTPIFSLWREALPAASLTGFRGILNSTTNLVLSLMEEGLSFNEAVRRAQDLGIAETDPSGDLQGWDAAIKVAALIRVLLGISITPNEVQREGIENLTLEDVGHAREKGQRWKLVCEMQRTGKSLHTSVKPILVGGDDLLYQIMGTSTALSFTSDVLGPLTVTAKDPTPDTTAYGLLADLISLYR